MMPADITWESLVKGKLKQRDALIASYVTRSAGNAEARGLAATGISVLQQLASGKVKAVDVLRHYIKLAIDAHKVSNCITEPLFEQALAQASYLDDYYEEHKKPLGPLHGLPISLKDQFDVEGVDSTLGWSSLINHPAEQDCVLVKLLKEAGAVPFVKTNLPQTIMIPETDNPIFGPTTHPMKNGYSPGGSTGGDAALISSGASLLGWGTDLGGSIRMPAHLCGLFGLRPSHGRLPYHGVSVTQFGNETVPSVVGPLSQDLDVLELATKVVIGSEPWKFDPKCVPIPWRAVVPLKKMKIGVLFDDGVLEPLPPIQRALESTIACLKAAGHEIVPWDSSLQAAIIDIMDELFVIDKCADFHAFLMPNEPVIPRVQQLIDKGKSSGSGMVYDLWKLHQRKGAIQKRYLDVMESSGIDFLLTPTMGTVASPLGRHCWWTGYTKFVNLLDLTAISFPVTTVDRHLDNRPLGRPIRNQLEEAAWREWVPEEQHGLPVGLQLVGKRLEEEKVLMGVRQVAALL